MDLSGGLGTWQRSRGRARERGDLGEAAYPAMTPGVLHAPQGIAIATGSLNS